MDGPKERPGQRGGAETGPDTTDASDVAPDTSTIIAFPHDRRWHVPMLLARRIGRTPPPLKPAAVRCWRVSVQAALREIDARDGVR